MSKLHGFLRLGFGLVLLHGMAPAPGAARGRVQTNESIVVVSRVFPASGKEDAVEARMRKLVQFVKAREPHITYRLHRAERPVTTFMFYEVYPSQAALDEHQKLLAEFSKENGPPPAGFFAKPVEYDVYRFLAE